MSDRLWFNEAVQKGICRFYGDRGINKRTKEIDMAIADVQVKGSWIHVYNERNKEISRMYFSDKELVGIGSDFFVMVLGSWTYTYDENCKEIARMHSGDKEVRGVVGSTFTAQRGSWIYTYDKNCKEISRRSA